jgi:CheY-like chemotaxis protein
MEEPDDKESPGQGVFPLSVDLAEVTLFLPAEDAAALERAAHRQGLTAAQLLRRLVHDFLNRPAPARPDSGTPEGTEQPPVGNGGRPREAAAEGDAVVLVVEDEPLARGALQAVLEARGHRVAAAGNGRDALNYLWTHRPPRVILLDLVMPVMNGWEFRRQQRQDAALAPIPVVVCSGVGDVPAEAELIGAESYLQKPIQPDKLIETVGRFCASAAG